MFIQTESTPNPATLKFLPGQPVLPGDTADFSEPQSAEKSPLAARIFKVRGVIRVFFGHDFIAVSKSPSFEWAHIKPPILGAIMEHYQLGAPIMSPDAQPGTRSDGGQDTQDTAVVKQIKEILDSRVRPAVAQDGGDIVFHGFERGVVYLHMQGACAGCPSSTITLKMGIENLLRHYIPEVVEVRPVI